MGIRSAAGYTIVEVSLFLAVSSLLFIIALIGTGNTVRSSRFTDSSRSLHAFVQKKYDDILNGVNSRPGAEVCNAGSVSSGTQTPGTSDCWLLGRLITLTRGTSIVHAYNIIGTEPAGVDYSVSDEKLIYNFQPTVVTTTGVDTFEVPWAASISGSKRLSDNKAVDAFALIRSPRSTRIVPYVFKEPGSGYNLATLINPSDPADADNIEQTANFCLSSAEGFGNPSKITVTGGQGQDVIQLAFDAVAGDCDGR